MRLLTFTLPEGCMLTNRVSVITQIAYLLSTNKLIFLDELRYSMYGKEYIKRPADYYIRKDPNIMQCSGLIGIGIATLLLSCCTGALAVLLRWRSYQHELAAIKTGQYLSIVGYQRLCQMTDRASLL